MTNKSVRTLSRVSVEPVEAIVVKQLARQTMAPELHRTFRRLWQPFAGRLKSYACFPDGAFGAGVLALHRPEAVWLAWLAVAEGHRRCGLGSALMVAVKRRYHARARKVVCLVPDASEHEPAWRFLKAYGFAPKRIVRNGDGSDWVQFVWRRSWPSVHMPWQGVSMLVDDPNGHPVVLPMPDEGGV